MFRSLLGYAVLAVVAYFALQIVLGLFGIVVGLLFKVLWLAAIGFIVYLVIRVLSPGTADKIADTMKGKS
ncbi:MAG TPA: hypothetical protein VFI39_03635 [Gemmatimonadales bacterium]|nr:hypothetical protein [Gemmatimonadales bacterium]